MLTFSYSGYSDDYSFYYCENESQGVTGNTIPYTVAVQCRITEQRKAETEYCFLYTFFHLRLCQNIVKPKTYTILFIFEIINYLYKSATV